MINYTTIGKEVAEHFKPLARLASGLVAEGISWPQGRRSWRRQTTMIEVSCYVNLSDKA